MPALFYILIAFFVLAPPVFGIGVILFGTQFPPHLRTRYALGGSVFLNILISTLLIFWGWVLSGEWAGFISLTWLWAIGLTVRHILSLKSLA